MLVTFKSDAYADIMMFGDAAHRLLKMMGHSGTVPSAILADDVPAALDRVKQAAPSFHSMRTTYFVGRETILATRKRGLSSWRGAVFAWMTRNAGDVTSYFCLPPNGVVELGARVEV